jgi:hypothetical protein
MKSRPLLSWEFLKHNVEMFGVYQGLKSFIDINFVWGIQDWTWLNITHKPYCTYHGWHCKDGCTEPKLLTKLDILKHREEDRKEMQKVESGPDGKCVYCGEFKGMVKIPDPNGGLGSWLVCETCKKVINAQYGLSLGVILSKDAKTDSQKAMAQKLIDESKDKLESIAAESFTPSVTFTIEKDDKKDEYNVTKEEFK